MPKTVQLHQIAHARSGDKGNCQNISVIPYDADH
ncbi:AtuA-related protein [Roseovarius sp. S1116L3]